MPVEQVFEVIMEGERIKAEIEYVGKKVERYEGIYGLWIKLTGEDRCPHFKQEDNDCCLYIGESEELRGRIMDHHRFNSPVTDLHNRFATLGIACANQGNKLPFLRLEPPEEENEEILQPKDKEGLQLRELVDALSRYEVPPKYWQDVWVHRRTFEREDDYYINFYKLSKFMELYCYWTVCYLLHHNKTERDILEGWLIKELKPPFNRQKR